MEGDQRKCGNFLNFFSCFGTLPLVSVSNTSKVYYDDVQHTQVLTCVKSSHLGTGKVDELHILDPRPLGGPPGLTGPGPPAWLPPPTLKGVSSLATFSLKILIKSYAQSDADHCSR